MRVFQGLRNAMKSPFGEMECATSEGFLKKSDIGIIGEDAFFPCLLQSCAAKKLLRSKLLCVFALGFFVICLDLRIFQLTIINTAGIQIIMVIFM